MAKAVLLFTNEDAIKDLETNNEEPIFFTNQTIFTESQEIVLRCLKKSYKKYKSPLVALENLGAEVLHNEFENTEVEAAYQKLSLQEKFEVISIFSVWGIAEVSKL